MSSETYNKLTEPVGAVWDPQFCSWWQMGALGIQQAWTLP